MRQAAPAQKGSERRDPCGGIQSGTLASYSVLDLNALPRPRLSPVHLFWTRLGGGGASRLDAPPKRGE